VIFCSPAVVAVRLAGRRLILRYASVDAYAVIWRIRLLRRTSGNGGGLNAFSGVRCSSFLLLRLNVVGGGRRFVYPLSYERGGGSTTASPWVGSGRRSVDWRRRIFSPLFFFTGGRPMSIHHLSGVSVVQSDADVAAINKVGTLL
jgi:hypothetical protein